MREIDILKQLQHQNIIRLYEVIDDQNDDKLYLVLEYANKGQIMDYDLREKKFKPNADGRPYYSEREVQCFARDIINALDCIHKHRVLHCDIKP
jgi:serine/threonine protein kinase